MERRRIEIWVDAPGYTTDHILELLRKDLEDAAWDVFRKFVPKEQGGFVQANETFPNEEVVTENKMIRFFFENKTDAENVLDNMHNIIKNFSVCTLADLHDLIGVSSSYDDHKKGWVFLLGVTVKELPHGAFVLELPSPGELTPL